MSRLAAVLTLALVCGIPSGAFAKDIGDWNAVQRLKPGTEVRVTTASETVEGTITLASGSEIHLNARYPGAPSLLTPRTILRDQVRELQTVGKRLQRRIPAGQLLLSSVIGTAVGVGIGAAYDVRHPYSDDPGMGKLVFGTLGFFVGPAVTGIGRAVYSAAHRPKLVYRAPQAPATLPKPKHLDDSSIATP